MPQFSVMNLSVLHPPHALEINVITRGGGGGGRYADEKFDSVVTFVMGISLSTSC